MNPEKCRVLRRRSRCRPSRARLRRRRRMFQETIEQQAARRNCCSRCRRTPAWSCPPAPRRHPSRARRLRASPVPRPFGETSRHRSWPADRPGRPVHRPAPARDTRRPPCVRTDASVFVCRSKTPETRARCRAASSPETRRCRARSPVHRAAPADRASGRSHLFMNVKIGTPRWRQTSNSLRVCGSMPLPASITITTASTAVSTR